MQGQPLLPPACMPATNPSYLSADAGAPVYFYEFQHRPQCLKDKKPPFVKADHTDEIRFVFGRAFLKGDIVMSGKKLASGAPALAGARAWDELGRRWESPLLAWSLTNRNTMQGLGGPAWWFTDTTFHWRMSPLVVLEKEAMKKRGQHLLDECFSLD